jgi:hypothetical protein
MKNKNGRLALNSIGTFIGFTIRPARSIITAVAAAASEPLQFRLNKSSLYLYQQTIFLNTQIYLVR